MWCCKRIQIKIIFQDFIILNSQELSKPRQKRFIQNVCIDVLVMYIIQISRGNLIISNTYITQHITVMFLFLPCPYFVSSKTMSITKFVYFPKTHHHPKFQDQCYTHFASARGYGVGIFNGGECKSYQIRWPLWILYNQVT